MNPALRDECKILFHPEGALARPRFLYINTPGAERRAGAPSTARARSGANVLKLNKNVGKGEDIKGRMAARPKGRVRSRLSKSIVLVDVINNSALLFETVGDMSAFLGRKSITDTGFVKKYMNPTKLYKNQYEFHYESDFKGTITGKGPRRE
jgi:hypothetical protein